MTIDLDKCQVQKDFGTGSNSVKKFYFDPNSRRCLPFYYNGRKGNLNRFSSLEICEQECLETNSNFVTEVIVIIIVIIFVIVSLVVAYKYAKYHQSQINYRIFQNQQQQVNISSTVPTVSNLAYENPAYETPSETTPQSIQLNETLNTQK